MVRVGLQWNLRRSKSPLKRFEANGEGLFWKGAKAFPLG